MDRNRDTRTRTSSGNSGVATDQIRSGTGEEDDGARGDVLKLVLKAGVVKREDGSTEKATEIPAYWAVCAESSELVRGTIETMSVAEQGLACDDAVRPPAELSSA